MRWGWRRRGGCEVDDLEVCSLIVCEVNQTRSRTTSHAAKDNNKSNKSNQINHFDRALASLTNHTTADYTKSIPLRSTPPVLLLPWQSACCLPARSLSVSRSLHNALITNRPSLLQTLTTTLHRPLPRMRGPSELSNVLYLHSTLRRQCVELWRNGAFGVAGAMGFVTNPTLVFGAWFPVIALSAGDCESFASDWYSTLNGICGCRGAPPFNGRYGDVLFCRCGGN